MARQSTSQFTSKKHLARKAREERLTRIIIGVTIGIVVLAVGLLVYGLLNDYVLKPRQTVLQVGDDKVSAQQFEDQAQFNGQQILNNYYQQLQLAQMFGGDESYVQSLYQQVSAELAPGTLGNQTLEGMIEDLLIRQEAERRGITVSEDEIEKLIQENFRYFPNGTPTVEPTQEIRPTSTLSALQMTLVPPTATATATAEVTTTVDITPTATLAPTPTQEPTPDVTPTATLEPTPFTEEAYQQQYATAVASYVELEVPESVIRRIFESQLYREKVREAVLAEIELAAEEEQVWARHILLEDEQTAQELYARLQNGEDFRSLAEQFSSDTSAAQGGDLGWFGRGMMVAEFENTAFALEIGEISEPVQSQFGWHIIQVLGHETRPLDASAFESLKESKFKEWLDAQRAATEVIINDIWLDYTPKLTIPTG